MTEPTLDTLTRRRCPLALAVVGLAAGKTEHLEGQAEVEQGGQVMATRRTQRDGIDSLIKAGVLPPAAGSILVPNPTSLLLRADQLIK